VEIIKGPLDGAALFGVLSNSDVREKLRRYAHRFFAVFVDASGVVVAVARSKDPISFDEASAIGKKEAAGTAFFIAEPGWFKSVRALQAKVNACVSALRAPPPTSRMSTRVENDEIVLTIVGGGSGPQKKPSSQ
jgi:hypothetical protein